MVIFVFFTGTPGVGKSTFIEALGQVFLAEGKKVGVVTSGTFSPCLKKPIAMGYVETGLSKAGSEVMISVRGKMQKAEVTKMPFVESRYYRVPE